MMFQQVRNSHQGCQNSKYYVTILAAVTLFILIFASATIGFFNILDLDDDDEDEEDDDDDDDGDCEEIMYSEAKYVINNVFAISEIIAR